VTTTTTTAGGVKVVKPTVAGHLHDYWGRVRGGDSGSLPAILGLIVLCLIFGIARPTFFSAVNFANLFSRARRSSSSPWACPSSCCWRDRPLRRLRQRGVRARSWPSCSPTTAGTGTPPSRSRLVTGLAIGFTLGFLVAKVGIPSFVVTLRRSWPSRASCWVLLSGGKNISIRDSSSSR
jgi:D-xylose transport system permease protein